MIRAIFAILLTFAVSHAEDRPNFVVILADDQGWGDVGIHGNKDIKTPNLDKLANEGAMLDRFFVQPVCAPTRAEFLTGRFFSRTGVRGVSTGQERMNPEEVTIAEVLAPSNYSIGAFGKWHNGSQPPYHPNDQGFQYYQGFTSGHWGNYFDSLLEESVGNFYNTLGRSSPKGGPSGINSRHIKAEGYITDHLTTEAIKFISNNKDKPFFCYIPYCTPHSPMQVPDKYYERFKDKPLTQTNWMRPKPNNEHAKAALAMVENIDWNVGRILTKLDELKLSDNTVVIYFSDNGPNGIRWNGEMKGVKGSTDEGGVRVPCFIRWPKEIPAGTKIDYPLGAIDLMPTMADMAGVTSRIPDNIDGMSIRALLSGRTEEALPDRYLIHLHGRKNVSVRGTRYRLTNNGKLVDPVADPRQAKDLSKEHPEEAKRMKAIAESYLKEVEANLGKDTRPFTVGYGPVTWLPARDGRPVGGVKRSAGAPNCSFFTNWKKKSDAITWHVEIMEDAEYEIILHYTCDEKNVGSLIEVSLGDIKSTARITEAYDPPLRGMREIHSPRPNVESYVKDFKPLSFGKMKLSTGVAELKLQALEIPGDGVVDVRWLEVIRINP